MKTYINTIKLFVRTPSVMVPYILLLLAENVFLFQLIRTFIASMNNEIPGTSDAYFFLMDLSYFLFLPFLFFLFIGYEFMRKSKEAGLDEVLGVRGCKNGWIELNQLLVLVTAILLYAVLYTIYSVVGYFAIDMASAYQGELIRILLVNVLLLAIASASMGYLISRLSKRFLGYFIVLIILFLMLPNTAILFMTLQMEYHVPLFWLRDFICLLPPDITVVADPLYGLPLEGYRICGMFFWIAIAVLLCSRKWFCTRKKERVIASSCIAVFMLIMVIGALNKGSILLMGNHPESATRKDAYYYLEHSAQEEEAGFVITDYDMSLSFGKELSADVTMTLQQEKELSQYLFTLYHGYHVKKIVDEKGENVEFEQEGDYITVENNSGAPMKKLMVSYRGYSPIFYSNRNACFLPGIFPYYPKAGFQTVYDGTYVYDETAKANYKVSISGISVVSNLEKKDGLLQGTAENLTLAAGHLEEIQTERSRQVCYPYQEDSYEIAKRLSTGRLRAEMGELTEYLGISDVDVPDGKTLIVIPSSLSFNSRMGSYYEFEDYIMSSQYLSIYELLRKQTQVTEEKETLKDIFFNIAPAPGYNPYETQTIRESGYPEEDYNENCELQDTVIMKMRKLGAQDVAQKIYQYLTDDTNTEEPLTFVRNLA